VVSKVMVATDRSPSASRAVDWAARMAENYGAELWLLQVLVPEATPGTEAGQAEATRAGYAQEELQQIAREIDENQTERLVIDSFTAMSPAFQTVGDLRTFTHVLLGKIVGGASGCTTLLITEEGTGKDLPWTGVEEFVADGVIKFSVLPAGDARVRYMEITKMRGTNHQMGPIPIDIGPRGIRIVHPHVRGKLG